MSKNSWWKSSVVYQIYPRSFQDSNQDGIGDIPGIIMRLDYLQKLGIDVIWLSPVFCSPMIDNGYDISDYRDISPEFGCMDDMEELIDESKKRGIRILLDLVVNHSSDQHFWFQEAKKSTDNLYRDYYIWRDHPNEMNSVFGGSAWEFSRETEQYYFHLFAKEQPDLNWENPQLREEIYDMINFWLKKGIGGFRLDVIDLIGKQVDQRITENGPMLHEYLQEMNEKCFSHFDVMTVGETWGANPERAIMFSDPERKELSMIFQFEHIASQWDSQYGKWKVKELDLIQLKNIFEKWQNQLSQKGWNSLFWNNHDLPRAVSKWGNDKEYRIESAKMLGGILHFMQGTPYIYQGEEIGMTNVKFQTLAEYNDLEILNLYQEMVPEVFSHEEMMGAIYCSGRDNARTPMQWNQAKYAGFSETKPWLQVNPNYHEINVEDNLEKEDTIFCFYQKLIEMRKSSDYQELIIQGEFQLILREHAEVFGYLRIHQGKRIMIMGNFSNLNCFVSVPYVFQEKILSNYPEYETNFEKLTLRPYELIVCEIQ